MTTIPPELISIARALQESTEAHQRAVSVDERHETAAHIVHLHERLLAAMRRHGIPFDDCEHAARIARTWLEREEGTIGDVVV